MKQTETNDAVKFIRETTTATRKHVDESEYFARKPLICPLTHVEACETLLKRIDELEANR